MELLFLGIKRELQKWTTLPCCKKPPSGPHYCGPLLCLYLNEISGKYYVYIHFIKWVYQWINISNLGTFFEPPCTVLESCELSLKSVKYFISHMYIVGQEGFFSTLQYFKNKCSLFKICTFFNTMIFVNLNSLNHEISIK